MAWCNKSGIVPPVCSRTVAVLMCFGMMWTVILEDTFKTCNMFLHYGPQGPQYTNALLAFHNPFLLTKEKCASIFIRITSLTCLSLKMLNAATEGALGQYFVSIPFLLLMSFCTRPVVRAMVHLLYNDKRQLPVIGEW